MDLRSKLHNCCHGVVLSLASELIRRFVGRMHPFHMRATDKTSTLVRNAAHSGAREEVKFRVAL